MEYLVPLTIIIVVVIAAYTKNRQEEKEFEESQRGIMMEQDKEGEKEMSEERMNEEKVQAAELPRTRELFLETLTKIGCQYEFGEGDDDRIFFAFQGEHFIVDASNERLYITILDTHWGHVELYDIDELSRLKKAINGSNMYNTVTTVYTVDEAASSVDVHSKSTILFVPQIPQLENYLRMELNEFFRAHHFVGNEMAKLREQENAVSS